MNKRGFSLSAVVLVLFGSLSAFAQEDVKKYPECKLCGMDRGEFSHSRMIIEYDDGSAVATCSLHCAATDLDSNKSRKPKSIRVADYDTKVLIDADQAVWVIGGSKPGVMAERAKWAFRHPQDAEKFRTAFGGERADFDRALNAALEDAGLQKRKVPIPAAGAQSDGNKPVSPSPKDKCPVCGMFVAKHPDFLAEILFSDGSYAVFDGAKDMFKYYFNLKKYQPSKTLSEIASIYVTEYYDLTLIDGRQAYYVIGSDIYGPMGNEPIPLATDAEAKTFLSDHKGKAVLKFSEVTAETIRSLDASR